MSLSVAGPQPALVAIQSGTTRAVFARTKILRRVVLVAVVGTLLALALVASLPEKTAADSVHYAPRAFGFAPGLIVDPTVYRADPSIVWDPTAHLYRMYATDTWNEGAVPEFVSDKVTGPWKQVGDALPTLPSWEGGQFDTWAPEVANINGVWTLWGSTADGEYGPGHFVECDYRATASSPAGPFVVDPVRAPCDLLVGGDIDPSPFKVGSQWWLVDKTNANSVGRPTVFYSQRIAPNGEPIGQRYAVLTSDLPWEEGLIEAPNFVESPDHHWWLIFSGGDFDLTRPTYRIAAVPCAGPEGGCDESRLTLLIGSNSQGTAPGEQEAFVDRTGQWWLAYNPDGPGAPTRPLALVKLNFDVKGIPYVSTP
jgi:Glycosyl hydrolases family 43